MEKYQGTERRKENLLMQERLAVLEEKSEKLEQNINHLDSEFKIARDSIISFSNKIPDLVKAIENLTEELKEHKKSFTEDLNATKEDATKHKKECYDIDNRLEDLERAYNKDEEKIDKFIRKNWRIGILGGFIGGLIGKLTPDLIAVVIKILTKIFVGI